MNFNIHGNKTQSHICTKGLLIIVTKLLRKVRGYLTLLMNTLQQSETDLLITYPCRKRIVIKSRDYRAWRTWHHCIVHVIEPVRVNNDRKFLCNQKTKTRADIRMYNRVNWTVRELYSMWSGSEKINNFKTYCDFWRELEERGTFSKPIPQKHHLDYVDKCKSPISSFLFQPVLPEE